MTSQCPHNTANNCAINFHITADDVYSLLEKAKAKYKKTLDTVALQSQPTFENTIIPIAICENEANELYTALYSRYYTTDDELHEASIHAFKQFKEYTISGYTRLDVYKAVRCVFDDHEQMVVLSPEDKRLVETVERDFRGNGLLIGGENKEIYEKARKKLADLEIEYMEGTANQYASVLFTRKELDGVPNEDLDEMETTFENGTEKLIVSVRLDIYHRIMKYARNVHTRKRLFIASGEEFRKWLPLLQEAVELRLQIANMLGYSSHAESVFDGRMAKSTEEVLEIHEGLRKKLTAKVDKEMVRLVAAKKADLEATGEEYDGFFEWDYSYYAYHDIGPEKLEFDSQVRQYFPVIEAGCRIIDIFERVFDLIIIPVEEPNVWHASVEMFEVWEADESEFIGHLYLDLHSREGKRELDATCDLRHGHEKADGTRVYPAAAIISNLPLPTESKPAFLSLRKLNYLMLQFGQAFTMLCKRVKWSHLNYPEREFMDAPAQVMAHWVSEPTVLQHLGSHYITGEPIPDYLLELMKTERTECNPGQYLISIILEIHDILIHSATDTSVDVGKIYTDLCSQVPFLSNGDTGVFSIFSHRHLMDHLDVGLYKYLWEDIFSEDMYFSRFRKYGIYNRKTGKAFRDEILRPGGSRSANVSLERFLGRKPNSDAYFNKLTFKDE